MNDPLNDSVRRILVIDDDANVHEDFRKILCADRRNSSNLEAVEAVLFNSPKALGPQYEFEVDSAFQGENGLAKVYHALQEGRPYSMAFLDVRMPPGWTGIEVAPKLWVADPDLQIVICTAGADYSWEEMFVKVGTSDRMFMLKKPFDRMEVLQLAHNLTDKWSTRTIRRKRQEHLERDLRARSVVGDKVSDKLYSEIMQLLPKKVK